jgi:hypothetical protein
MRIMSNFAYKDAKGQLTRVPVIYGDMNRQVAQIVKKNTENTIPSAPFIACYIKDLQFDQTRLQDPTFVSKIQIRERAFDEDTKEYLNQQGSNYTIERLMPAPYIIDFSCDIWTTNTDQKLQLWEQIVVLFTPSLELQTTDNFVDWTSISSLRLKSQTFTSRTIPQGLEQDIDILNLVFETNAWITPPAKVKKMGIITKIIASAFVTPQGAIASEYTDADAIVESFGQKALSTIVSPGNFDLLVLNNIATLIVNNKQENLIDQNDPAYNNSWRNILDLYPGTFRAGLSQLRLTKPDNNEIVAYISLDPLDDTKLILNIDADTVPANTIIEGRGTVDAIVNPETFNPINKVAGTRYLILEDINVNSGFGTFEYNGPAAWKNSSGTDFQARANDIIEWDGTDWNVVFSSQTGNGVVYITNSYTGIQYKWEEGEWSKSFDGIYSSGAWRLIL